MSRSRPCPPPWRFLIRSLSLIAAATAALTICPAGSAASAATLHRREHRQVRSLHRYTGTVRFFRTHPRLARTAAGRKALRVARVWLAVIRRELAETRTVLKARFQAAHRAQFTVPDIICAVFGQECREALVVARCESGFSPYAVNGQYFGVFQMGSHERARFGGSSVDPWEQVRAAYRYWLVAGWRPWECA